MAKTGPSDLPQCLDQSDAQVYANEVGTETVRSSIGSGGTTPEQLREKIAGSVGVIHDYSLPAEETAGPQESLYLGEDLRNDEELDFNDN